MTGHALPIVLEEIKAVAGEAAALKLAAEAGGTRRYVPKRPSAGGCLAQLVGLDAAIVIARLYGGEQIEIPMAAQWSRLREAAALVAEGLSEAKIARRMRMTERNVRYIKAKLREEGVRPGAMRDLFAA